MLFSLKLRLWAQLLATFYKEKKMLVQNRTCPQCGHKNVADARYCGRCEPLFLLPQQKNTSMIRSSQQSVLHQSPSNTGFAAFNSPQNIANDLLFLREQLFQAKDGMKQDSLRWRTFGRWMYRHEQGKQFDELFAQYEANVQDTYLRYHEQQAAHLLRRQQQQYDFEAQYAEFLFQQKLLDEAVERRFIRLAKIVDLINRLFVEEDRFAELPPEIQQEIALRYLLQAERLCLEGNQILDDDKNLDYLEEDF
jgi:ribosomal protein S27AE